MLFSSAYTVLVFAGYGLSVCLHEFGHAIVAYWGGDRSVKDKGYLTLNPLRYTHPTYSLVIPLIFLLMGGIPLPGAAVYINPKALKNRGWRSAVSAAGPLATGLVAVILAGVIQFLPEPVDVNPLTQDAIWYQGLALLLTFEIAALLLNLIPMPGLDGYGIIRPWLPVAWQQRLSSVGKYSVWILFGAFWVVPGFSQGFWRLVWFGVEHLGVDSAVSTLGLFRFQMGAPILFLVMLAVWIGYDQWQKRQPEQSSSDKALTIEELEAKLATLDAKLAKQVDFSTLTSKAFTLSKLRRDEEALACIEQSLTLNADNRPAWLLKGFLCQSLNHSHEAIAAYQEALSMQPQDPENWLQVGRLHFSLQQYEEAIAAFQRVEQQAPNEEIHLRNLLWMSNAYFYQQRYEACLAKLDELLAARQDDATALYNKACCYAKLEQIEEGITALAQALAVGGADLRQQAQTDEDLAGLRSHPDFSNIVL